MFKKIKRTMHIKANGISTGTQRNQTCKKRKEKKKYFKNIKIDTSNGI